MTKQETHFISQLSWQCLRTRRCIMANILAGVYSNIIEEWGLNMISSSSSCCRRIKWCQSDCQQNPRETSVRLRDCSTSSVRVRTLLFLLSPVMLSFYNTFYLQLLLNLHWQFSKFKCKICSLDYEIMLWAYHLDSDSAQTFVFYKKEIHFSYSYSRQMK